MFNRYPTKHLFHWEITVSFSRSMELYISSTVVIRGEFLNFYHTSMLMYQLCHNSEIGLRRIDIFVRSMLPKECVQKTWFSVIGLSVQRKILLILNIIPSLCRIVGNCMFCSYYARVNFSVCWKFCILSDIPLIVLSSRCNVRVLGIRSIHISA